MLLLSVVYQREVLGYRMTLYLSAGIVSLLALINPRVVISLQVHSSCIFII